MALILMEDVAYDAADGAGRQQLRRGDTLTEPAQSHLLADAACWDTVAAGRVTVKR